MQSVTGDLTRNHRMYAIRGHLLEMAGDIAAAAEDFRAAARYATNIPERRYLERKAGRLSGALLEEVLLDLAGGVQREGIDELHRTRVSFPVEVWQQPRVPDSGATYLDLVVEPAF